MKLLDCTFRGAAESKYIMELRTCTVRKRTKKYVPVSRTSSRATSASRADHPLCRGPETFWQGQTSSWLTEKEKHRSHPAGLQSGLSSTLVAPSLSGYLHACAHAHPYPPFLWHKDWCGLPHLRPWQAPFPREQTLSLLLLEMESVFMPRENRSRPLHNSPGPTC